MSVPGSILPHSIKCQGPCSGIRDKIRGTEKAPREHRELFHREQSCRRQGRHPGSPAMVIQPFLPSFLSAIPNAFAPAAAEECWRKSLLGFIPASCFPPSSLLHQTPVSALLVEWDKAKCCSVQPSPCRADLEMEMSSTSPSLSSQNLGTARNQPLK